MVPEVSTANREKHPTRGYSPILVSEFTTTNSISVYTAHPCQVRKMGRDQDNIWCPQAKLGLRYITLPSASLSLSLSLWA